jgi:hypothetical protein
MQMERIAVGYQLVEAPVATDAGAVESEQSEGADGRSALPAPPISAAVLGPTKRPSPLEHTR